MIDSILDAVGETPLVRLGRLTRNAECAATVALKCEHLNPSGSHKIRGVLSMIDAAERRGDLVPGSGQTLLIATGGNLGKAALMVAAIRDYRVVFVIPDNYSRVRIDFLRACGATVVLAKHTAGEAAHVALMLELADENPDWLLVNQFNDLANAHGHRDTAREILRQVGRARIDAFVAGVGSAGHLMGITPLLKAAFPALQVIGVQPDGCDLERGTFSDHGLQGIAVNLIPPLLDTDVVGRWTWVAEAEAIRVLRALVGLEGLSVGPSSAAVVAAALRVGAELGEGSTVVAMSYDSLDNYPALFPQMTPRIAVPNREGKEHGA